VSACVVAVTQLDWPPEAVVVQPDASAGAVTLSNPSEKMAIMPSGNSA